MNQFAKIVLLAAGMMAAQPAWANFRSLNGLRVYQLDAQVFEVVGRGPYIFEDFWCSAGDYAHRKLGIPWSADLYISRSIGPSEATGRRSAVQFTTDPTKITEAVNGRSYSFIATGRRQSVTQARGACDSRPIIRP